MSVYRIDSFNGVALPIYNVEQDQGGGTAETALVKTINGYADFRGTRRARLTPAAYTVRGIYAAGDYTERWPGWKTGTADRVIPSAGNRFVFLAAGTADVQEKVDALRAQIGVRGNLVRFPWVNQTATQTVPARLMSVRHTSNRRFHTWLAEVEATFEALSPYWKGTARSTSSAPFVVNGNAPVLDAVLTVVGPATAVRVIGAGIDFSWAGSLAAGALLVISGVQATAAGVPTTLTYAAAHTAEMAIELQPGSNSLSVVGGASWSLAWNDSYA